MNDLFDEWLTKPMFEDFESISSNSYTNGQNGPHLPNHLLSAYGLNSCETKRVHNLKLFIDGFPIELTESGLRSYLKLIGCKTSSVKLVTSNSGHHYGFIDFESSKEVQKAIELIKSEKTYKLNVRFALTQSDKQTKDLLIEKELIRSINRQKDMKPKIDLGQSSVINGKSVSPFGSDTDSSQMDILSPLAKSNKLLKVLNRIDDECSVCFEGHGVKHLHFILDEQQLVDPSEMPALIETTFSCLQCNAKSNDLKMCSQCKGALYCTLKCQTIHWIKHKADCKPDLLVNPSVVSNPTIPSVSKPMVSSVSKPMVPSVSKPMVQSVSKPMVPSVSKPMVPSVVEMKSHAIPSQSSSVEQKSVKTPISSPQNNLMDSPIVVNGSPKVVFNKDSVVKLSQCYEKRIVVEQDSEDVIKSVVDDLESNSKMTLMISIEYNVNRFQYFAIIYENSLKSVMESICRDYPSKNIVDNPLVGDFVVAKGSDNDYYRAVVLEVKRNGCKLYMIDHAFIEDVESHLIFKMKAKYYKTSAFGVILIPHDKPSAQLLELTATKDNAFLNGVFIKKEDKNYFKIDEKLIEIIDFNSVIEFMSNDTIEPIATTAQSVKPLPTATNPLPFRALPLKEMSEVMAVYQEEDNKTVFYGVSNYNEMEKLMKLCAEHSLKFSDNMKVNPLLGEVYLVRASDEQWYRGVVKAIKDDSIDVQYIDFGNDENVKIKFVMELTTEMKVSAIAPLALKCKVQSTQLSAEDLNKKINQSLDGAFLLKMEVLRIEDNVHIVELK